MGFTTGLIGGFTLTASLLYLSARIHTQNRVQQAALLRQQTLVLDNLVNSQPQYPPLPDRVIDAGIFERAKDKWNRELERGVRQLQNTDWDGIRESAEETISALYRRAFQKTREAIPDPPKK